MSGDKVGISGDKVRASGDNKTSSGDKTFLSDNKWKNAPLTRSFDDENGVGSGESVIKCSESVITAGESVITCYETVITVGESVITLQNPLCVSNQTVNLSKAFLRDVQRNPIGSTREADSL